MTLHVLLLEFFFFSNSASKYGNLELIKLLTYANANLSAQVKEDGMTALMRACYYNFPDLVEYFLNQNLSVEVKNKRGETPLYIAAFRDNLEIVEKLISQYRADLEAPDKDGDTALSVACYENKNRIINCLLSYNANVNVKGIRGDSPLHIAVANCGNQVVKQLISKGANVDAINEANETPLHIASRYGDFETFETLLLHAKNLDQCTVSGNITVFKILIESMNIEKLKMAVSLIKAGCDVNKSFNKIRFDRVIQQNSTDQPYRILFNLANDSPFDHLLKAPRSLSLRNNGPEKNNFQSLISKLVELTLKAGYKVNENDYNLFKQSWLLNDMSQNEENVRTLKVLDNLFCVSIKKPLDLASLCKLRLRNLLQKPLDQGFQALNNILPKELLLFLSLEN